MNENTTWYDNNDTDFTQFQNDEYYDGQTPPPLPDTEKGNNAKAGIRWKKVAVGAGTGILLGSVAAMLMGMKKADEDNHPHDEPENNDTTNSESPDDAGTHGISNPELIIGEMEVAAGVDDSMTFAEAFAAAREEVGPGGIFEWHGNTYATYTAAEWDQMSAQQQDEFNDHFAWNHHDHHATATASHHTASASHTDHNSDTAHHAAHHTAQTHNLGEDEIEVVHVEHNDNPSTSQQTIVDPIEAGAEVEILGVVHDDSTGANIGAIAVDNQEVIFVDVNDDSIFDFMACDVNGNGEMDDDEIVDISSQHLSVNDLGGIVPMPGSGLPTDDFDTGMNDVYEG